MPEVLFDARSAGLQRTSGWERYTRGLAAELEAAPSFVQVWRGAAASPARRIASDWVHAPAAMRPVELVHLPTYPPSPLVRPSQLVYTLHDLTWWRYPETASALGKHYYRHLAEAAVRRAHVVTPSESVRREVMVHFGLGAERVSAVHPGVTSLGEVPERSPRSRPFLLSVGTHEPRKNLARLARAFLASGLASDCDLVVVGRPAWGAVPEGVTITGALSDEELAALYAHAVGVVVPSLYEGFGLPLVEAMAAGTPLACSDIPVFREVAGDCADFFDPLSEQDMCQALLRLASGAEATRTARGRRRAAGYNWSVGAASLLELYRSLLGRAGA